MLYGILYVLGGILTFIVVAAILWRQIFPPEKESKDNP